MPQPSDRVQQFFARDLPLKAASDVGRLFASEGSIAFKIADSGWTFRFGDVEPVVARFDRSAPLQLWFTEAAFVAFVDGSLDVAEAVRSGAVRARGAVSLLEVFGRFLQDDASSLGWDAGP